jgi:hypothetical protein
VAIARRIREPLGGKPGRAHPKALTVSFHVWPSGAGPVVQ